MVHWEIEKSLKDSSIWLQEKLDVIEWQKSNQDEEDIKILWEWHLSLMEQEVKVVWLNGNI